MAQPINPTEELDLRLTPTGRVSNLSSDRSIPWQRDSLLAA
jgi:hypothetical protein